MGVEDGERRIPEEYTNPDLQPPNLVNELRNTLDPRVMLHNFVTAPPCGLRDMLRDLPTIGMTLGGGLALTEGVDLLNKKLLERIVISSSEARLLASGEIIALTVATLAIMGVAHYINRRLPPPFGD